MPFYPEEYLRVRRNTGRGVEGQLGIHLRLGIYHAKGRAAPSLFVWQCA